MYFKVLEGTETYSNLEKVWQKIRDCNQQAKELVQSLGFSRYATDIWKAGGGISCIESEVAPEGFKKVGRPREKLYYPKAKNKELLAEIEALPVVTFKEYNDAIGYKEQFYASGKGTVHSRRFGSSKHKGYYLIETPNEAEYIPNSDMIEILSSEYKLLNK